MQSLFTRVYLNLLLTLALTATGVWLVLDQVNRYRFNEFVEYRIAALQPALDRNGSVVAPERLNDWTTILSRLTGTEWGLANNSEPTGITEARWWSERAGITLPLNDGSRLITASIADWDELLIGTGYLVVNALSLADVDDRDELLARLSERSGIAIQPVGLAEEPLGFLQQRQLQQGQAVIVNQSAGLTAPGQTLYIPMGQGNALKLGPVHRFEWITPLGLLLLAGATLIALGALIYLTLTPLRRRLVRMTRAVDAIEHTPDSVDVPDQPRDELGTMGQHINNMAARLVDYGRRNKALNQAVSHDLKTPLAQFKFALAMLKPEDRQRYVTDKMDQAVTEMETLVEELLLFHSLSDTDTDQQARSDLTALLPSVIETLEPRDAVSWDCRLPNTAVWLKGEERLLRRLFLNILSNALKYADHQVRLTLDRMPDERIRLRVDDDGPGIPAGERERVLEPFYRLDRSREGPIRGHGLGLAISRDILELLGGAMVLDDSDLGGCRVTLLLAPYKAGQRTDTRD
ncbi:sensor histidine kinase [Saccharospirillum salsuginis]|uniref:histidine kinase n=1 Tax=Saccharospirillum salsuginis TaxID=418750 RepID=A0A918K5H7_9GAMM|nr:ATP-binding protein [Saccharospirillum salsuginis]GGX50480.1 hypothetical protein GCM10007392_17050 [Saccharospirillum salsuginis]